MKRPKPESQRSSAIPTAVSLSFFLFIVWTVYDQGVLQTFWGVVILVLAFLISLLMYLSIKYGKGKDENLFPDNDGESACESAMSERSGSGGKQSGSSVPAEQLAFERAVAAAAGYVEGSEGMSPDLVYVVRQQLRRLSSGNSAVGNELLQIFLTHSGDWDQMCVFRHDPERIRVFFGVLAEIITGDALVSEEERARFSEVAAHFGYSADEAMNMLHDCGRFRRFWGLGDHHEQSGEMSYDDALWILDVSPLSSISEIRQSYMRLAQRYHPDNVRDRGFSEDVVSIYRKKFEIISGAWNVVKGRCGG